MCVRSDVGEPYMTGRELSLHRGIGKMANRKGEVRMYGIPKRRESATLRYSLIAISALLIAATLGGPPTASAEVLYGSIVGNVTETSGAAVPKANRTSITRGTN